MNEQLTLGTRLRSMSVRPLLMSLMLLALSLGTASAQMFTDVVKWTQSVEEVSPTERILVFKASIEEGWHLYGTKMPENGPQATMLVIDKLIGAELSGELTASRAPIEHYDKQFEMTLNYYEGEVELRQRLTITDAAAFALVGGIRYMVCNDENCLPPTTWDFTLGAASASEAQAEAGATPSALSTPSGSSADLWTPVIEELKHFGDANQAQANSSLIMIFVYGFLGGLVALLTPCVWPMIPMTVSFFLKRTKDRSKGVRDAVTYGLSIIGIYLVLGLAITAIFGASALNSLATHAVFNILFFLLLVFFAISFFGAFEIVLPAKWTNKMDQKADSTTGFLSILFMAFTLALVSFSCTGPIIGTLLVEASTKGEMLGPAIGMLGFSIALALPFALFAIFPSMLQSLPQSGGWLNSVKVVLAFLELALSLKFLSVADQAYSWGILDREVFLSLWIVIFALLGLYLLGKLRFPHDSPTEKTSITGLFLGIISMAFAVYMIPGLWGAPLKAISAFSPLPSTQDFSLYDGAVHAKFDDYESGMEYARKNNKPVLIDFSGYGCVNCREMETSVWSNPEVKDILEQDYVLITLMVDDKRDLPEVLTVQENGSTVKLRTIGDKWSYLQRVKFGSNAQPYYIGLDTKGKPITPSRGHDKDVSRYIDFLRSGLKTFGAQQSK